MSRLRFYVLLVAVALAMSLSGCKKNLNGTAYALTSSGQIIGFNTAKPTSITNTVKISGLPLDSSTGLPSENVVQMDYRPRDQQLYAVTSANHVYLIDPVSGAATALSGGGSYSTTTLASPQMDFDPVQDIIRVISSNQNLQVEPDSGALISNGTRVLYASGDTNASSTPALAGIAYNNDTAGAGSTTLYALDASTQSLVRVGSVGGSPLSVDSGVLFTVGSLGVGFGSNAGFDIDPKNGTAFAALAPSGGASSLYTIDLANGTASRIGTVGDGSTTIIALAVAPAG